MEFFFKNLEIVFADSQTFEDPWEPCIKVKVSQSLEARQPLPALWKKNVVHTTQFDIYLEAEVGKGLRCGLLDILYLDTLCGHA